MNEPPIATSEISSSLAMHWRMLLATVESLGTISAGELLTLVTITWLHRAEVQSTVSQLSKLIELPKSSVSRYVSTYIAAGLVTEYIDPKDRRRRYICLTSEGRKSMVRLEKRSSELALLTDKKL